MELDGRPSSEARLVRFEAEEREIERVIESRDRMCYIYHAPVREPTLMAQDSKTGTPWLLACA